MKKLNRLGLVGCGNVGSALVMELAKLNLAGEVTVASRSSSHAEAAILDAGSAYPETAAMFKVTGVLEGNFDIVVVTAGILPHVQSSRDELLQNNLKIALESLEKVDCQKIVVIGTPVDKLTEELSKSDALKDRQIIGFGGQLDVDRAKYTLVKHSVEAREPLYAIGEHGPLVIPVYENEEVYEKVRESTATFIRRISVLDDNLRNLATAVQLARLLQALAGKEQILCVSAPHDDFNGLSITWPYLINQNGLVKKIEIPNIGNNASALLSRLLDIRKKEATQTN